METDEEAFRAFVAAEWRALVGTAYLLTGDHGHAEDIVQTALARTYRHWPRVARMHAPRLYVRRAVVNLVRTHWGRLSRFREEPRERLPERAIPDLAVASSERSSLVSALRELPPRTRAVLVLRYFEDLPEAEVAQILGCSVGTVKSTQSRGLARLRTTYPRFRTSDDVNGGVTR